ncbi:RagB/SusD family nutrient uptake outer membrane protein [Chitinophaga pinensis]|uniref:SusD-like N-terminal domain-containing protein n=1 Tax=Chitinophaga pinensis TaxID=79329 RepID=A0A5C6LKS6_9BACT|nr:RagB/SusD family nutrient uptake outer membrane protein [Chitinophaga pinensis]TWV94299.1 hypothetical protein FEF09_25840 [Chitinophaga pinensis]
MTNNSAFNSDVTAAALMTGLYYDMSSGGAFMGAKESLISVDYPLMNSGCNRKKNWLHRFIKTRSGQQTFLLARSVPVYLPCKCHNRRLTYSHTTDTVIRQQLMGEAKFTRAFCYFYLVNLFGDVPLAISTDYKVNATLYRSSVSKVYDLIIADLQDAGELLRIDYLQADMVSVTPDRVRPNKWTAVALMARVQLYRENWQEAINAATRVIDNHDLYDTSSVTQVFQQASREAIWQLQTVDKTFTDDAALFMQQRPVHISNDLLLSFEKGDLRRQHWLSAPTATNIPLSIKIVVKQMYPGKISSC